MENKEKKKGPGKMGMGSPKDKPKNFKGSLKRLVKYIGRYNKAIIVVCLVLILSTILSVVSPKILGRATTELSNNIIARTI